MFRPQDMEHVRVFVPINSREQVMHDLHEKGLCQIDSSVENTELLQFVRYLSRVILRLERYSTGKIVSKKGVVRKEGWLPAVTKSVEKIHNDSLKHIQSIKQAQHDLTVAQKAITTLRILPNLQTSFYDDTNLLQIEIGVIPSDEDLSSVDFVYASKPVSKDETLVIGVGLHDQKIHKTLFTHGFKRIDVETAKKTPKQLITNLEEKIQLCTQTIDKSRLALKTMANNKLPKLLLYQEEVEIELREQQGILTQEVDESFASFEAYVPSAQKRKFESAVKAVAGDYVIEAVKTSEGPTLLSNRNVVKPFELITRLYSVPKIKGFDPTFFIAISFPLFFGLMLTDFVYGLAITIFATVMFRKAADHDEGIKGFSALLVICGLVTMVMGIIFGSYFGNFFQMMGLNVPFLLDSMVDIIPMIMIVLTLGMIHITVGLIIGFVEYLKNGQIRRALSEQGVWLCFVLAIVALLIPHSLGKFAGIIFMSLSVFMQFFFTMRKDGVINAFLSLFNYSGFMGDVFSYIRLMALAIGTSGIALAVNFMAVLATDMIPGVGIVFAIVVFIVGHLFNLVMNGLGAFIHTLRLHFLEHFSKYYDGGGKEYTPFHANRKFTEVKRNG